MLLALYTQDTTVEFFDPGSAFGLKDILNVRNDRRIINFYPSARLDGLTCREEYQVGLPTVAPK